MKGVYSIILECERPFHVKIGALGRVRVEKGWYVYTGSGLGESTSSVEGRVGRHWKSSKKLRWHIDYLTHHDNCTARFAACLQTSRRLECALSRNIATLMGGVPLIRGIGASDCRCDGHLLRLTRVRSIEEALIAVSRAYRIAGESVGVFYWDAAMRLVLRPSVS